MIGKYKEFFRNATNYEPYPYQENIFSLLQERKSVVLRAPTGSGKTLAVLMPFLYNKKIGNRLVDRVIYALPMRSLAFDLYNSTGIVARKSGFSIIEDPEKRTNKDNELCITIQTGERQNDHYFEGDIIFTTIDQLLSGYLTIPVSLPERLGNVNIGAIIGSLVVFDEVHLMEFQRSFLTAVEMMNRFKDLTQFFVMTATLTQPTQEWLAKKIKAESITCRLNELRSVSGYQEKSREYTFVEEPLSLEKIIKEHKHKTLILCNTVRRSQYIYSQLRDAFKDTNVALLHSRFFKKDRKRIEDKLQEWFGRESKDVDAILISTQVVEAGIDISCDTLHTEIAPANAIIQRAGRCARYGGRGIVWVYEIENLDRPLPYTKEEVDLTRKELSNFTGRDLDSDSEEVFVERVHAPLERLNLIDSIQNRREAVNKAMQNGESSNIQSLIREINSVNLLITANPEELELNNTWPEMLSIPRSTLGALKKKGTEEDWLFKIPVYLEDEDFDRFSWIEKESVNEITWLAAINPKFARYTEEVGLILGEVGEKCISYIEKPSKNLYSYSCESYLQHVGRVINEANVLLPSYYIGLSNLASYLSSDKKSLEKMIFISCALHDAGKLSTQWQSAMMAWQNISDPFAKQFVKRLALAHTTYDPRSDWKRLQDSKLHQGPHAAEGAYASFPIILQSSGLLLNANRQEVAIACMAAIARHHGPRTSSLQEFVLISERDEIAVQSLEPLGLSLDGCNLIDRPKQGEIDAFRDCLNQDQMGIGLFFYWLCVRLIRLSDQKASSKTGDL